MVVVVVVVVVVVCFLTVRWLARACATGFCFSVNYPMFPKGLQYEASIKYTVLYPGCFCC